MAALGADSTADGAYAGGAAAAAELADGVTPAAARVAFACASVSWTLLELNAGTADELVMAEFAPARACAVSPPSVAAPSPANPACAPRVGAPESGDTAAANGDDDAVTESARPFICEMKLESVATCGLVS
jgi:hypothetical protein